MRCIRRRSAIAIATGGWGAVGKIIERRDHDMCFRPSAVTGVSDGRVQTGECPTCGQPVAANAGVTSGTCPYCGNPIPVGTPSETATSDSSQNVRII